LLKIVKKTRSKYWFEDIVVDRALTDGKWVDTVERIHNAVSNNQISNRAVVLGNGPSRLEFDIRYLKNSSGLLGADTVQTYGCNALYRDFIPDFLVVRGHQNIIRELANSDYVKENIVYASAINLLDYPNKFYLIPYDPCTDAGTTALYLAAFDGHKKIFMLGFDNQDTEGFNYNVYANTNGYDDKHTVVLDKNWIDDKKSIFDAFNDVEFIRVTQQGSGPIPEAWKYSNNFRQISHREFVLEANL